MPAITALTPPERALFWRLAALNALALGTFGVVAPAAQSLFLDTFDLSLLPRAWLAIMAASALAAGLLRRLGRRFGPSRCLAGVAAVSALCLAVLLGLRREGVAVASFLVFVWRDVYVLLLLETLWIVVNVSPLARRPSGLYGALSAAGTGTTILAALAGAGLARRVGTETLLWAMVPILALAAVLAACLPHQALSGAPPGPAPGQRAPRRSWRPTRRVAAIFAVIALGHVALTLFDYQVNLAVQQHLPDADLRTQAMSALHSATNLLSLALQLAVGPILARVPIGMALAAAPLAMGVGLSVAPLWGGLAPLLATRLAVKGLDHSLYRVAKERLWVPLSYVEKTDGKAMVDIAGSRAAKGAASLGLLCLAPAARGQAAWGAAIATVVLWGALALAQRSVSSPPAYAPASRAPSRGRSPAHAGSGAGRPPSSPGPRPPRT